jgi:hypothetical protein
MTCINKNDAAYKILSNNFTEEEIAQIYINNTYSLPTPAEAMNMVSNKPSKASGRVGQIETLFESNSELANQVYESLGLKQLITSNDRIVFGHPTIGKSYLKNKGEDKFISLDDDYATEINNKVKEISDKYNVTTYQVKDGGTQKWNNEYNQMMQEMFNVAKQKAISENKTLFTSNTNLLKNNAESFDKVINLTDNEFEKRIQERGAKYDTKEWKSQINQAVSEIPTNKVINTDKYLSDLFITPQQKEQAIEAYSNYLDTIFPDSKLKDIVYHGSKVSNLQILKSSVNYNAIYFTDNYQNALFHIERKTKLGENTNPTVYIALINSTNPLQTSNKSYQELDELSKMTKGDETFGEAYDVIIANNVKEDSNDGLQSRLEKQYAVFEPSQIHILGSKQDIQGFKEFVGKDVEGQQEAEFDKELADKIQNVLQELYPEIELNITNTPVWEEGDNVMNQKEYDNQVKYRPKVVDKIVKNIDKINQWEKNKSIDEDTLWKKIGELGISKQQLDMLKQSKGKTIEDKIISFVTNYSYTVEVNTAKTKGLTDWRLIPGPGGEGMNWAVEWTNNQDGDLEFFNTEQEARNYLKNKETVNENTQYYANLTVAGGTNYTENEISTPLITPSIKGHAQFSTDNGIGWFRSDDKDGLKRKPITSASELPNKFDGVNNYTYTKTEGGWLREHPDYESELETDTKELIEIYNYGSQEYNKDSKTRRILELQSDLFQKGRDKEDLVRSNNTPINTSLNPDDFNSHEDFIAAEEKAANIEQQFKQNQFLQLLNKDNNWVTFFIKSIIQDSARKGYEKVLFPRLDTIIQIESAGKWKTYKEAESAMKDDSWQEIDHEYRAVLRGFQEEYSENPTEKLKQLIVEIKEKIASHQPSLLNTAKFYENDLTNILNKQYGKGNVKAITDEYGNTWNELTINQARDLAEVLLQKDEAGKIIGQANIKAMTVLIDAVNQKQDTLPHEYAHHYIAWYRNSPIVQEAIKKWGSEEALVQSIGEQVVKQKGEAYEWWKKFVNWILGKFGKLSSLDKQELTQILTDAFLTRQDISTIGMETSLSPVQLTPSQEQLIDEFLEKENSFIKEIGVGNTEQLVSHTFQKAIIAIEEGRNTEDAFAETIQELQERRDELESFFTDYDITPEQGKAITENITALNDAIAKFDIVVERVNVELRNTKGIKMDDTDEDNDVKGEIYNLDAYEVDPKEGLSSRLKIFLSGIKEINPKAVSIAKAYQKQLLLNEGVTDMEADMLIANMTDEFLLDNFPVEEENLYNQTWFQQDNMIPFNEVHKVLLAELAGVEESYEDVIASLRESSKDIYWMKQVIDKLENADTQTKTQFVVEMPKHNLQMKFVQVSKKYTEVDGKKISFFTTYVRSSNSSEVANMILEGWKNSFISSNMLSPKEDDYVFNKVEFDKFQTEVALLRDDFYAKPKTKTLDFSVDTQQAFINAAKSTTIQNKVNKIYETAVPVIMIGTKGNKLMYIVNPDYTLTLFQDTVTINPTRIKEMYAKVGIELSDKTTEYVFKNRDYLKDFDYISSYILENYDGTYFEDNLNPIAQTNIRELAKLEAKFNPNRALMPANFRTQGKQIFAFTAKNFLTDRVNKLSSQELISQLSRTAFAKDSMYLQLFKDKLAGKNLSAHEEKLLEEMAKIEDLDLQVLKDLEAKVKQGDQRFTRIDEIEQEYVTLGLFANSNTRYKEGKRIARYVFPTFSDKTRSAVIAMEANKYDYDLENNTVTDETVDRIFQLTVEPELRRIINYHNQNHSSSNSANYAMGGGLFYFYPTLNGLMAENYAGKTENIHNIIKFQAENGKDIASYDETGIGEGIDKVIKAELKNILNQQIEEKLAAWETYKMADLEKTVEFDYNYLTQLNNNKPITTKETLDKVLRLLAADFKLNDMVAKSEMHKLFIGDPAMMFKKSKEHAGIMNKIAENQTLTDSEINSLIDETRTNIGKRLALEIATGKKLFENKTDTYIQLMLKDPKVNSDTLPYISLVLDGKVFDTALYDSLEDEKKKKYLNDFPFTANFLEIEGADAQEYTTLKEYVSNEIDAGKLSITKAEIDEILAIEDKVDITSEELSKLTDFMQKITYQPQKPVYSGDVFDETTNTMRVVYIKSSAFPLSRHFTRHFEIDNLRVVMERIEKETGNAVRASYTTANKLGSVTSPLAIYDNDRIISADEIYSRVYYKKEEGNLVKKEDNTLPYLVLPRNNFRIQQENPVKEKSQIKGGSQERKLVFNDLLGINEEIDNLYREYMGYYDTLYQQEYEKFIQEITDDTGEEVDLLGSTVKVNMTKLAAMLKREAISRNYPIQDIRGLELKDGKFPVPLMFHGSSDRYENLINSLINNRISNVKMPGHSFILGSSEGFKIKEVSTSYPIPSGVTFVKGPINELKNSHFIVKSTGQMIDKPLESYADDEIQFVPAQIIVPPFLFMDVMNENGRMEKKKINISDYTVVVDGIKRLDTSRMNPEILKMFGFRIPTSGQMSMASMEIVGFLPEDMGDLILAPRDFTKQMGSDFDVDKLYAYTYEVTNENGYLTVKDSLKNKIVKVHHDLFALKNTAVQTKILSPLSFDVAKEQAALIEKYNPKVYSILDDEYQKMKRVGGASGKLGTGTYSLAVTFHASAQHAAFEGTGLILSEKDEEGDLYPIELTIAGLRFTGELGGKYTLGGESRNNVRFISDVLSQRQNYSLDNEKEQLMAKLNDNAYTMPFNLFMDEAGFDLVRVKDGDKNVDISLTDFIRTQPVILEYVKMRNLGIAEEDAITEIFKKYPAVLSWENVVKDVSFAQQLFDEQAIQSAIFELFLFATKQGETLRDIAGAFNVDSAGLGKSIFDVIEREARIENLYENVLNLDKFASNTINGMATEKGIMMSRLFDTVLPYRQLNDLIFKKVEKLSGDRLSVEEKQLVFQEFKKFLFSSHLIKNFQEDFTSVTALRNEMFFQTDTNTSFAQYAKQVRDLAPIPLLNAMNFEVNTNELPSIITWNNAVKDDNDTRYYMDWLALFTNKGSLAPYNGKPMTYQKFAQMLVTYAYLEGGIQGGYQYIKYLPIEYLITTGMAKSLDNINSQLLQGVNLQSLASENFFMQLIQHNPSLIKNRIKLDDFVKEYGIKDFNKVDSFVSKQKSNPNFIRIYNYNSITKNRRIRKKEAEVIFIYDKDTNTYLRIPSKGIYGMSEYDYASETSTSLVQSYNKSTIFDNKKVAPVSLAEKEFDLSKDSVRGILEFVSKSSNEFNSNMANLLLTYDITSNVQFVDTNEYIGEYDVFTDTIRISNTKIKEYAKENKYSDIEAAILEEVMHAVTKKSLRDPSNLTAEVQDKVNKVKTVYERSFKKAIAKGLFTQEEYDNFKERFQGNRILLPGEDVMYNFYDVYEFAARIIANPEFREALDTLDGDKTFLDKIIDSIADVIKTVLETLGIANTGVTKEGIASVLDLVNSSYEKNQPFVEEAESKYSFTYKGITISTEFQLSKDQEEALVKLIEFAQGGGNRFTLQGAAGTGKTSIIGYLSKYLKKGFLYTAPTHAATANLAFATVKTGNSKMPMTVASSITTNKKTGKPKLSIKAATKLPLGSNIIVVDEASMLNSKDYDSIKGLSEEGYKVIFLGDFKQIPEVSKKNVKLVSKAFTENPSVELNTVHRTSIGPLKTLLQKIRDSIVFQMYKLKEDLDNVKFYDKYPDFDAKMEEFFKAEPEDTLYIGYTNRSVSAINKKIREDVFGRRGEIKKNDIVIGYLGYRSKQIELGNLANSLQFKVESVYKSEEGYSLTLSSKKLNELIKEGISDIPSTYRTNVLPLSNREALENTFEDYVYLNNNQRISEMFNNLNELRKYGKATGDTRIWAQFGEYSEVVIGGFFKSNDLAENYIYNFNTGLMEQYDRKNPSKEHQELEKEYYTNLDKFIVEKGIDFGHAITIHKSQGSTIKNVFFDANTLSKDSNVRIMKDGKQVSTEMQSLNYVGMSRASHNLFVYEGDKSFEEIDADSPTTVESKIEISNQKYTRQSVEEDKDTMYLFTDNAERTSAPNASVENVDKNTWYYKKYKSQTNKPIHFGSLSNPTSAVIRGLNNAYPISTMSAYGTNWTDANFELFKQTIDDEINQIKQDLPKFSKLKIGNYRIGQGGLKAKLPLQHQNYLDSKLKDLGIDNTQSEPTTTQTTPVKESTSLTSKKNVFTVTPIQSADKKAVVKASIANKFIGFGEGIEGSSTESYRQQILEQEKSNIDFQVENSGSTMREMYLNRTAKNASADATLDFGLNQEGESWTKNAVIKNNKKYIGINTNNLIVTNEVINEIVKQLNSINAKSLNIAGMGIYNMKDVTQEQIDNYVYQLLSAVTNSPKLKTKIENIRTGGQTGFDEAGAKAGEKLEIRTLVLAPKGFTFRNKDGKDISNKQQFINRFKISLANSGNYSSNDVIFVSIGGKRGNETVRKQQQDKTIREALKAVEAGATLITDNKGYVESSDYNEGEKRLAKNLEAKGYVYSEITVDRQLLGVWNKKQEVKEEITFEEESVGSAREIGRHVNYKGRTYIVTKINDNGTIQIYSPVIEGENGKLSVSESNLEVTSTKSKRVTHKGADYLVTPKDAIISLTSNRVMKWDDNNGDRIAILDKAKGDDNIILTSLSPITVESLPEIVIDLQKPSKCQ